MVVVAEINIHMLELQTFFFTWEFGEPLWILTGDLNDESDTVFKETCMTEAWIVDEKSVVEQKRFGWENFL